MRKRIVKTDWKNDQYIKIVTCAQNVVKTHIPRDPSKVVKRKTVYDLFAV